MSTNPCPDTGLTVTRVDHPTGTSYLSVSLTRPATAEDIRALARVLRPDTMTGDYRNPLGLTGLADTDGWATASSPLEDWAPYQPTRWESLPMTLARHVCERNQ